MRKRYLKKKKKNILDVTKQIKIVYLWEKKSLVETIQK